MAKSPKPAQGERAAMGGYYAQYLLAAELILRRLDEGRLEWVRLADPEAGRLDDFQIATPNRLDAYQFKWGRFPETLTYNDLTREGKAEGDGGARRPPLITQLAEGWRDLRRANPARRVVAHLTTNDFASNSTAASLPVGTPAPARPTLAAFLAEGWAGTQRGGCPPAWQATLDALLGVAGVGAGERAEFLRDCEIELGCRLPSPSTETRSGLHRWQNLQALLAFLERTISDGAVVEMSSAQLLSSLGWGPRYASRSRHEFPDPAGPYAPITATLSRLEDRMANLPGGYLAVVGPPGSGKSTLLTRALRRPRPERVVRYYAYVPEAQDPAVSRGESVNFLHDVCLALQQAGASTEGTDLPPERELLLERFHRQLALLGAEHREVGRKTVILIDGLDHIDRELRPARSMLLDLPSPDQVPAGVFLVLGTQTDQLADLSERIRHALDQDGRRIPIGRMDRASARAFVQAAGLPVELSSGQLDGVYDLSDGHPLALGYLVQALRGATDAGQVEAVLSGAEPYRGDIEAQYRTYWQSAGDDAGLAGLLAAVARLRDGADLDLLARWFGDEPVRRLAGVFRRYFVEEPGGRWRFFHNSFRVFLCRQTARAWSDRYSEALDRQAHRELADRFAAEPPGCPGRWEELYHRVAAGDHEGVCRLATQGFFREQAFSLRPLAAVAADVEIALPSAAARDDVRAFAAMSLARAEVEVRSQLLREVDLPGLLLDLGETRRAAGAVRDGNRLRVGVSQALEFSVLLDERGEAAEARRVFELAEPLGLLSGQQQHGMPADAWGVLATWVAAAARFSPLDGLLASIPSVPLPRPHHGPGGEEEAELRFRCRLLTAAGVALVGLARWDDLERVLASLPAAGAAARDARCDLLLEGARRAGEGDRRRQFLDRLRGLAGPDDLVPRRRVSLADAELQLQGDEAAARGLTAGLPLLVPDLDRITNPEDGTYLFGLLLRHARLLYQLGDRRGVVDMVPREPGRECAGRVWFLRDVVAVARLWAWARTGRRLGAWEVRQEVAGIMQRFNRTFERSEDRLAWHACRGSRAELYRLLVRAGAEHGRDALVALREAFEEQWQGETLAHWPPELRRGIVVAFAVAHPDQRGWAAGRLREISEVGGSQELYEQARQRQQHARAWITAGEPGEARQVLERAVREANGIYGEDYQFTTWVRWLDRLAAADPAAAAGRLDWFARATAVLRETADGRGIASSAARVLVQAAARLDPGRGLALSRWLMDQGVLEHADRLGAFLEAVSGRPGLPWRLAVYALADLVVPFDVSPDGGLARSVVLAARTQGGPAAGAWALEYLERRVDRYALPRSRGVWREGLRSAAEQLGLPPPVEPAAPPEPVEPGPPGDPFPRRPPDVLVLQDEGEMPLADILRHEEDLAALRGLAEQEHYLSGFDWRVVLGRLYPGHPPERLSPLIGAIRSKRRVVEDLVAQSRACRQRAEGQRAWGFALLAVEATDRYSWSVRHGDGLRLTATRALVDADPRRGRQRLWHLLVHDGTRDATILEDVLSQLRDEVPVLEVWPEVDEHLRAMFEPHLAGAQAPPEPRTEGAAAPLDVALAGALLEDIDHPVAPLSRAARRACGLALLDGEPALTAAFRSLLARPDHRCRAALEILDAASLRATSLAASMLPELGPLRDSQDAAVAVLAADLCLRAGAAPRPPGVERPSAGGRMILLPETALRGLVAPKEPPPGQPWPDSDDPRELLAVVREVYALLAEWTGRQELALLLRGASLMRQLSPEGGWSARGERELYRRLDDARLQFTYRRPRADVAFRATFLLIGELWQAGEIGEEGARLLVEHLRQCDPGLALAEPAARPAEVAPLPAGSMGDREADAWLSEAGFALPMLSGVLGDGRLVLAEVSEQEALGRAARTECRLSALSGEADGTLKPGREIPQVGRSRVSDYPGLEPEGRPLCLVVRHSAGSTYESPAGEWVAFNPALARALGWARDPAGLFRWVDAQGQVAVESLWWVDGPVGLRGMPPEYCVGEGWLVLASPHALAAIASRVPGLRRLRVVTRYAAFENGADREETARELAADALVA